MALPEEQQMESMFKDGGMEVDPVSGNEVPPGSLPEEVRDDVPAQLSEGEYVVPADVLRFYGMKFFEDLRSQAKEELQNMEAEGRIGGQPVEPTQGEDLTPEEIAELESIGMAVGGLATQQVTQSNMPDPYQQQQLMYNQGAPVAKGNTGFSKGGAVKGYADGGLEDELARVSEPTFTKDQLMFNFGPGFSFTDPSYTTPEFTTVTLFGPGGDMVTLTLPTQKDLYDQYIKDGYTTEQVEVTTETTVGEEDRGGGPEDQGGPTGTEATDYSGMTNDQLSEALSQNNTMNAIATGLMAVSPVLGLAAKAATKSQKTAIEKAMKDRDMDVTEDDQEKSFLSSLVDDVTSIFSGLLGSKDKDKSTTTSTKGTTAPAPPSAPEGLRGEDFSGTPTGPTAAQSEKGAIEASIGLDAFGGEGPSVGGDTGGSSSGNNGSTGDVGPSGVAGTNDGEAGAATGGQGDQGQGSGWGGMKEGGLVSRPKKNKKK